MYKYKENTQSYENLLKELKIYYSNILNDNFKYTVYDISGFRKSYHNNSEYVISVKMRKKYRLSGYFYTTEHHYLSECKLNNISRINKLNKLNKLCQPI